MDKDQVARSFINKYMHNPAAFSREILGAKPWGKQTEIMKSVDENMQTVVQSCYGSGKSFTAAQVALWFLYTRCPCKIICTSSSWPQVEKILFAEIHAAYNRAKLPLGGRPLGTELQLAKDWFVIGVSPQINVDAEAYRFEGYHSPHVLVIMDQAQGINPKLWDVGVSLVSNEKSRILVLGNPTSPSGRYYEACRNATHWNRIKISAFDTPNVQSGKDLIPGLVSKKWMENRKADWGDRSPLYITKVLAEFPAESDDVLIPMAWVDRARNSEMPAEGPIGLGVDVARFGSAQTVLCVVHGGKVTEIKSYRGKDTMETAGQVKMMMNRHKIPAHAVCIDDSGLGGGVVDRLREDGQEVRGINNGSAAGDPEHFANLSAEMHWNLRKLFENDGIQIPNHEMLCAQLPGRKYSVLSRGKGCIKIETKEEMMRRGLKSPDFPDALVLALKAVEYFNRPALGPSLSIL
jgi:hypothetical protein